METDSSVFPEVAVAEDRSRARGRDEEFADFFRSTWARLFRVAYSVTGDRSAAEDALQSAYAKAYASWRRVSSADHPEAYVRRMLLNEVFGTRRRGWWRSERPQDLPETPAPSHEASTDERDALWRAVLSLPPGQRAVVVLRYYEQLSEAEIAEVLGCSRGTVKSQASDALKALRLRNDDHAEGAL